MTNEPPVDRDAPEVVVYRLDPEDRIVEVNETWKRFARGNDAAELADGVLGRSLWDFITDSTTATIYRDLLVRVRDGRTMTFPFRCDAPALRRWMRMTMRPLVRRAVLFESEILEEARASAALWARYARRGGELVCVCSWCKRVRIDDQHWMETDAAVDALALFIGQPPPMLTHGMCPTCYASMMETLAGDPRARG